MLHIWQDKHRIANLRDKAFPPAGIEVVSWYVMMGIGQVATLRLPASRGQSYPGELGRGQLSHRILSDLRLQAHRPGLA